MHKFLSFAHNVFGVFLLVGIFTVAASAVLSLSPIALKTTSAQQIAGISSDAEIISNRQELIIKDTHRSSDKLITQLLKQENNYIYAIKKSNAEESTGVLGSFEVANYNLAPVKLNIQPQVPGNIKSQIIILVKVGDEAVKQIATPSSETKLEQFVMIPADSQVNVEVQYYTTEKIFFPVELNLLLAGK